MLNKKSKIVLFILIFFIFINSNIVRAVEIKQQEYSEEYKEWLELPEDKKEQIIAPRMFDLDVNVSENKIVTKLKTLMNSVINSSYDLRTDIRNNLAIRNQKSTKACWTFATLSSLETNLALNINKNKVYDFSESHMDYSTSQSFTDGRIENGFSRDVSSGGNFQIGTAYLTNGMGAVLEEDMPFIDTSSKISIENIKNKKVVTKVTDTEEFYFLENMIGEEIDSVELDALMIKMKEHIKENGSISAGIHGTDLTEKCYNSSTGAIYCKDEEKCKMDHNISIIGWNDNYSIDKFTNKPNRKGAWIIRNSWGESVGNNGFMYVSYEDVNIYKQLFGIEKATEDVDYDKIYQYNELGYNNVMTLSSNKIYIANVFKTNRSISEELTEVSLNVMQKVKCKVFVNPKNESKNSADLEEVELLEGNTETFDAGYHTLEFKKPIKITGDSFVVVIEIEALEEENSYCTLISKAANSFWNDVEVKEGVSYINNSFNLERNSWSDLGKGIIGSNNQILVQPSNLSIKAFTKEIETTPIPTATPTIEPTATPTQKPTSTPTVEPAVTPIQKPTSIPTVEPTTTPTQKPISTPTVEPTTIPTQNPTSTSTIKPTSTHKPTATSNSQIIESINTSSNSTGGTTTTSKNTIPYAGKTEIILGLIIILSINIIIVYKKYKKIY